VAWAEEEDLSEEGEVKEDKVRGLLWGSFPSLSLSASLCLLVPHETI
jgi:hypothetical protein